MASVEKAGAKQLFLGRPPYPSLLAERGDAPPVITFRGHISLLNKPAVAIVGARNASAAAIRFSRSLAAGLSDAGLVVVSGLARGIDGAAHQGSLEGGTVGVIAGGLDVVYPPEHKELQGRIHTEGLPIPEAPTGGGPTGPQWEKRG